ncbi:MAG: cytochrome c5 [Saprospiraceae bacterium]|jgi:cytochrome c5
MKAVKSLIMAAVLMAVSTVAVADDGKDVFNSGCAACHASGIAGAPKVGDKNAWAARIAQDVETIYAHAIDGFQGSTGVMPPKGGFMNLSDEEIILAVDYMIAESK